MDWHLQSVSKNTQEHKISCSLHIKEQDILIYRCYNFYFVAGVKLFDEPPESVPPTLYTPSNRVSDAPETYVTPYINVCDVFVNWGDESNTVALLTVLGHLYEKRTAPELSFTAMYLPDDTETELTAE